MHPEQLLLGCIASDDPDVRSWAVARIIQIRSVRSESSKGVVGKKRGRKPASTVRVLELPNPIYFAKDFTSMIDWSKSQVTEPPVLQDLSEEDKGVPDDPIQLHTTKQHAICRTQHPAY